MSFKKGFKSIHLQTRLIFYSTLMIVLVMTLIILLVEKRQSATIQEESKRRGMTIARNLAAVSTNALLTYNYVVLEQNAERVALEEDMTYVIIHDKEGRVAAYSQRDEKQGTFLTDEVSLKALEAKEPLIQAIMFGEKRIRILDIAIPVYIKESQEKWGTIRIGLSMERMYQEILRTRLNLLFLGFLALLVGILGSIFFARRITYPISQLVEATISASRGNLDQRIEIHTRDEIEELGKNFNHMIQQIRLHQNELEQRLREITSLKAYTDNVISSMINGLITLDLDQRIVTLNGMAERILGIKGESVKGVSIGQVLGEDHPINKAINETLFRGKEITHAELEIKKNGHSLWLMGSTSFLSDGRGERMGVLIVFQDITELKLMEERLRQADRLAALGTLSAGLAHEIKNPLSAIKTFVQLLPKKMDSSSFMEKFHGTVPREIERIHQLVEDLLELTRRRKKPWAPLNINTLIHQVIELHEEEMKRKGIVVEAHLDSSIPLIQGDSDSIYRAFSNLVINAIQAMPKGGKLMIRSELDRESSLIQILFQDTGIGMDEETVKNLFNPFFTTKDKGVGLGMALTHKIIEDHKGVIEVMSEKEKGSTFILKIPL
jgi:PAS domain S-box-containing protein